VTSAADGFEDVLQWDAAWRERSWDRLTGSVDVAVVGGGVVGAGVARLAARSGVRVVLLERGDFASGTSSRSSQQVHGGLRYLAQGRLRMARSAVAERERLLAEAPGLVRRVDVVFPLRAGEQLRRLRYEAALVAYDALAGRAARHGTSAQELAFLVPELDRDRLASGLRYSEGVTDDARLVLAVLQEAARSGATVLNHAPVTGLLRAAGRVVGVSVRDALTDQETEVLAGVVINATGAWTDRLRAEVDGAPRMRPLRGSHLVVPGWRFPSSTVVNVRHPRDGRPVSVTPWLGATVIGTTDLAHDGDLDGVAVTSDEVDYLLEAVSGPFRALHLTRADVVATWSGVRPTVGTGAADGTRERRDHVVWSEQGLLTVTGGKLTTFRAMARDAVAAAANRVPALRADDSAPLFRAARAPGGRPPADHEVLAGTPFTLPDLRRAARAEAVQHLDDLLLRRTRLGLLLPSGGEETLDLVRDVCLDELGWDEARWTREVADYRELVRQQHGVPASS
jgi:glycerol-3-phosphate dehydrogenase